MVRISLVNTAHQYLKKLLHKGDIVIDATVGNGRDTTFLLAQVQSCGHVYGFDIQKEALVHAQTRLGNPNNLTLFHASHAQMDKKIPFQHQGHIRACLFNLGYLPSGNKKIIILPESTISALEAASQMLAIGSIISIIAYPGHCGGDVETLKVQHWCKQLNHLRYKQNIIKCANNHDHAPRLFLIEKLA